MPADYPTSAAPSVHVLSGPLATAALFPDEEVWAPIPEYPGYFMSSLARCASFKWPKGRGRGHGSTWIIRNKPRTYMAPVYSVRTKRHFYRLCRRNCPRTQQVGFWMLLAFVGPRPTPAHECCHNDGNSCNDRLENLRWDTRSANTFDTVLHRVHWSVRLTPEQVREIRKRLAHGERVVALSREYGVDSSSISRIRSGHRWAQLAND